MRYLLILLALFLLPLGAWGKVVVPVALKNGKSIKVAIFEYTNPHGKLEQRFETDNLAGVILGHARDMDGDGRIETYFIFGDQGLTKYTRNILGETSTGAAREVISQHAKYSGLDYFTTIGKAVLEFAFSFVQVLYEAERQWYQDWMDLEEFSMAIERHKAQLTTDEQIFALNLMLEASQLSLKEFEDAFKIDFPIWWAVDTALVVSGMALAKWASKTGVATFGKKITTKLKKVGGAAATRLGINLGMKTFRTSLRLGIKGVTTQGMLGRARGLVVKGLKNIAAEWTYIAYSTGIQLGVEAMVNLSEIYDDDPKQMARNMMNHPGIQENVSISVADSLAMAAAHGMAETRAGKFALMGIVGASSSLGVGLGLSGEQDSKRIMLDTAWAIGVDSFQMMIDLHVLHKFKAMALKNRNSKIKLAGYAIVFVSQVAGYYAYSRATEYFDPRKDKEGEFKLIPIHVAAN